MRISQFPGQHLSGGGNAIFALLAEKLFPKKHASGKEKIKKSKLREQTLPKHLVERRVIRQHATRNWASTPTGSSGGGVFKVRDSHRKNRPASSPVGENGYLLTSGTNVGQ